MVKNDAVFDCTWGFEPRSGSYHLAFSGCKTHLDKVRVPTLNAGWVGGQYVGSRSAGQSPSVDTHHHSCDATHVSFGFFPENKNKFEDRRATSQHHCCVLVVHFFHSPSPPFRATSETRIRAVNE